MAIKTTVQAPCPGDVFKVGCFDSHLSRHQFRVERLMGFIVFKIVEIFRTSIVTSYCQRSKKELLVLLLVSLLVQVCFFNPFLTVAIP